MSICIRVKTAAPKRIVKETRNITGMKVSAWVLRCGSSAANNRLGPRPNVHRVGISRISVMCSPAIVPAAAAGVGRRHRSGGMRDSPFHLRPDRRTDADGTAVACQRLFDTPYFDRCRQAQRAPDAPADFR
jgi:hypothetical protein